MPERTARVHRWPAGVLRGGRAVAFLILASGINGTVETVVRGWDSRWLFVAAVGAAAAVDGWLIGIAAAAGAVVAYQLTAFGTFRMEPQRDGFLLAMAIVAAVAARAMRLAIARPQLAAGRTPALLTGTTAVTIDLTQDENATAAGSSAIESLRRALADETARSERERIFGQEQEARARAAIEELNESLRRSQTRIEELQGRSVVLQAGIEQAESAARAAAESAADHERSAEQLRSILRDAESLREAAETRAGDLELAIRDLQQALAGERALRAETAAKETALKQDNEHLRAAIAGATAERNAAVADAQTAKEDRDQLTSRLQAIETSREAAMARAADAERSRDQLLARAAELESARRAAVTRVTQLEETLNGVRQSFVGVESARDDAQQRAAALVIDIERMRISADQMRADADQLRFERDRDRAVLNEALQAVSRLEQDNERLSTAMAEQRQSMENEHRERLQTQMAEVIDIYNQVALDAEQRTAAALEQARVLTMRIEELEREHGLLRAASERATALQDENASLAARMAELQLDHEGLIADAERAQSLRSQVQSLTARMRELEEANADLAAASSRETGDEKRALAARIAELEAEAQALRRATEQQKLRSEAEWSEKFARSAMEITQRFQGELSVSKSRSDATEAEARRLADRVGELEQLLAENRAEFDREKSWLDAEWNEKLQTIVAHLATDHESDLGQATLEREEARAEARRLSKKLSDIDVKLRDIITAYEELQKQNQLLGTEADQQRTAAETLKSQAAAREAEWNARLAANALELTQRFNGAMATADARLMEANEEAAHLASRVRELDQIIAGLRSSDDQRRAIIDAEWNEKLQTIVNHLATDHEADIGQAMLEKEEARAEARMFSMRASAVQKNLEAEREALRVAKAEWSSEREQLLGTIEALRRKVGLGTSAGTAPVPRVTSPDGRASVVVVHRDSAVRAIAKHALESAGYDVTTAADGLEAFRVATTLRPDAILAEAQMPKLDGRELVQMLKSRADTALVKIVLMTSGTDNGDRALPGEYHADDFLRDPANIEALKATLAHVLAARA